MWWILFVFLIATSNSQVTPNTGVAPWVTLNNGLKMPGLAFGTWLGFDDKGSLVPVVNDDVQNAVGWAIDAGYRHIDTAQIYDTEPQLGRAICKKIQEGVITRDDIFVTTKLWSSHHAEDDVVPSLKESLKKMNLTYIDLFLIHWPIATQGDSLLDVVDIDYLETWRGMVEALDLGLTKSIGVSNFNQHQLARLIAFSSVKPAVLQIEVNLNLQQAPMLEYCRSQDIKVMGYTPFGSLFHSRARPDAPPPRTHEPALVKMADMHNKTVPQIALRYLLDLGVVPIPKSVTKSRVEQNIQVFDFELTCQERDTLRRYDNNYRVVRVEFWANATNYPFEK